MRKVEIKELKGWWKKLMVLIFHRPLFYSTRLIAEFVAWKDPRDPLIAPFNYYSVRKT